MLLGERKLICSFFENVRKKKRGCGTLVKMYALNLVMDFLNAELLLGESYVFSDDKNER